MINILRIFVLGIISWLAQSTKAKSKHVIVFVVCQLSTLHKGLGRVCFMCEVTQCLRKQSRRRLETTNFVIWNYSEKFHLSNPCHSSTDLKRIPVNLLSVICSVINYREFLTSPDFFFLYSVSSFDFPCLFVVLFFGFLHCCVLFFKTAEKRED